MAVKVFWTDKSIVKLQEIFDYYESCANKEVAKKTIKSILERSHVLESYPGVGVKEPLLTNSAFEYRFIVEGNFKIIYRYDGNLVFITSVFDCRQNPQILEGFQE